MTKSIRTTGYLGFSASVAGTTYQVSRDPIVVPDDVAAQLAAEGQGIAPPIATIVETYPPVAAGNTSVAVAAKDAALAAAATATEAVQQAVDAVATAQAALAAALTVGTSTDTAVAGQIGLPASLSRAAVNTAVGAAASDHTTPVGAAIDAARLPMARAFGTSPDAPRFRTASNATTGATGTTATLNKPPGATVGDTWVVAMHITGGVLPTTPTGWALVTPGGVAYSNGTDRVALYARRVSLVESASVVFTFPGSTVWRAGSFALYGVKTIGAPTSATDATSPTRTYPAGQHPTRGMLLTVSSNLDGASFTSTPGGGFGLIVSGAGFNIHTKHVSGANTYSAFTSSTSGSGAAVQVVVPIELELLSYANGFEAGTLTGWSVRLEGTVPAAAPAVIVDPVNYGPVNTRYVTRFSVLAGQSRCEICAGGDGSQGYAAQEFVAGDDVYFGTAIYLPHDYVTPSAWQLVSQWKADRQSGGTVGGTDAVSPVVGIGAGQWGVDSWIINSAGWPRIPSGGDTSGEAHTMAPLSRSRGGWTKLATHIGFSNTPATSLVEVFLGVGNEPVKLVFNSNNKVAETINGYPVETRPGWWPKFQTETPGAQGGTARTGWLGTHARVGIYRDPNMTSDAHICTTGLRIGRSLPEVLAA